MLYIYQKIITSLTNIYLLLLLFCFFHAVNIQETDGTYVVCIFNDNMSLHICWIWQFLIVIKIYWDLFLSCFHCRSVNGQ